MNNIFQQSEAERKGIIEQTCIRMGDVLPQVVEKDLWVTAVLQIIFSLPFAERLVFKGGTSLTKVWHVIERFSEDIDLAIDREYFGFEGDLTVKQLKRLRKASSLFVKETFCSELKRALEAHGLQHLCSVEPQPDGEGDRTYPEPRKIFVRYHSLFDAASYLKSEIVLEIGARSLIEPTARHKVQSLISETFGIDTSLIDAQIITALAEKTFLEKAFLLHEIFTGSGTTLVNRKSRHLYDLERLMDTDFAANALADNLLWQSIHHHREIFTRIAGVDYSHDIRSHICLVPPPQMIDAWRQDYEKMQNSMISGKSLPFDELLNRMRELEQRFANCCKY